MKDPDPTGTGLMGWSPPGVDLTMCAVRPLIHYKGRHGEHFLTADVYALPGVPRYIMIMCPVCAMNNPDANNSLKISEDNKKFDLDLERMASFPGFSTPELLHGLRLENLGPRFSCEPFRCTWESQPSLRRGFGFGVCDFAISVTNNIGRDA
jgi:hypothetical protein